MLLVKLCGLPVIKFQHNFMFFTGVIAPKSPQKRAQLGPEPKKVVFSSEYVGKVKNRKYPEAETWHPESIDEWSSYRLCEN